MSSLDFPVNVMVEPTNYCDSQCPLCPTGAGTLRRAKGHMDVRLFHRLVDEIAEHETSITLWNYGEPFLHPHIFDMIRYAASRGTPIVSSTNGHVFYSTTSVDALATCGLTRLIVSIDGATEVVNAMYRRGVELARVLAGLDYFREVRQASGGKRTLPALTIQMIAFRHNEHEIEAMRSLAERFGAAFEVKTANLNMVPGVDFAAYLPDVEKYRRYLWDKTLQAWRHAGEVSNRCSFVETGLVINWSGTVNPCCYDYQGDYLLGNVNEQSIAQVWKGDSLRALRDAIKHDRAKLSMCAKCAVDQPRRRLTGAPS
jgi:radical SAM protein with 4Fe4S-binding SPASM domain